MINLTSATTEPPIIKGLSRDELEKIREVPLTLRHLYPNQCVERHIKVITDASSRVLGKERPDRIMRLTLKTRKLKLMKKCQLPFKLVKIEITEIIRWDLSCSDKIGSRLRCVCLKKHILSVHSWQYCIPWIS